ncbi:hypothetical protein diail_4255 [Diaporthe ilicicola]|nr:hypothetical protein diail_4255 [Diaporthe ilicicola]
MRSLIDPLGMDELMLVVTLSLLVINMIILSLLPGSRTPQRVQGPKKNTPLRRKFAPQDHDRRDLDPPDPLSTPSAHRELSHIESLPVELLMQVIDFLSPDNIRPCLHKSQLSMLLYMRAQKNLRMVCLVSKQMDAVARPYLYRAAIINNVDVLSYFLRSLDENNALGQHVKYLSLEVPFDLEGADYRRPNVAVLKSRPTFSEIPDPKSEESDMPEYVNHMHKVEDFAAHVLHISYDEKHIPTFEKWAWNKDCEILSQIYYNILLRTENLESFCFGMICSAANLFMFRGFSLRLLRAMKLSKIRLPKNIHSPVPLMSKLKALHLVGADTDSRGHHIPFVVQPFLGLPSLRALKSFRDDGGWYGLNIDSMSAYGNWPCTSITHVDLRRSRCKPQGILQMCTAFPSLESLCISTEYETWCGSQGMKKVRSQEKFLSTELAKLEHLRELVLDLHYDQDVRPWLGPHGLLILGGLNKLVTVRAPLHYLTEVQPGNTPVITNLTLALPSSVEQLTVTADLQCMEHLALAKTPSVSWPYHLFDWVDTPATYRPRHAALDILESVSSLVTGHFRNLKEVTYSYDFANGDPRDIAWASRFLCCCVDDFICVRCRPRQALSPCTDVDNSMARWQILGSGLEDQGICVRAVEESSKRLLDRF